MGARGLRTFLVLVIVAATVVDGTGASVAAADAAPVIAAGRLAGLRYHLVAPGESIKSVARRYGVTVDAIRAANGMTVETWYAGARVLLDPPNPPNRYPGPTPPGAGAASTPTTAAAPPVPATYTVKSGDGFDRIAKRTGTTVAALLAANGLTLDDMIIPGQQLTLPGPAAPAPTAPAPAPTSTYTVKSGDSFARIAKRHGTTIAALVAANGTTVHTTIIPGQQLVLPAGAAPAPPNGPAAAAAPTPAAGLVCPLPGSTFTYDWGFPRTDGRFHEGLDMFAPAGTPVLAPVDGTVSFTTDTLAGNAAVLKGTDTWQYFAGHLSKFGKKTRVKAGDVIGYVGSSGNADGGAPHLHIEMRPLDGRPTNPWHYLRPIC